MVSTLQNAELGGFLRSRRERLEPEAVGLERGPRRRAPGLRREEVALLAHVSPTWYAYLEQGREVRPSVEVIDALAEALRLGEVERRYLRALGSERVLTRDVPVPDLPAETVEIVRDLVAGTEGMGFPVYAVAPNGSLIAGNTHMTDWYGPMEPAGDREVPNMITWFFTAREARERIHGWDRDARDLAARIRFYAATSPAGLGIEAVVSELREQSPDFDRWWLTYDVADQESRDRSFVRPDGTVATLKLTVLRLTISPALTIVFHLPSSGAAAACSAA